MKKSIVLLFLCLLWHIGSTQSVRVITYNIRYDNPGDGPNQWKLRKQKVIAMLKAQKADIIGVQEALVNQVEDLKKGLPAYFFVGNGRDDGKNKGEFSGIFFLKSKFDPVSQGQFWLSPTPEIPGSKGWDAALTRICTFAEVNFRSTHKTIFVFNTHFDHIGVEARRESAHLILNRIKEMAGDKPVILCGDFNTNPEEEPYSIITSNPEYKLTDASKAESKEPVCTYTGFEVNSGVCNHIDFIFCNDKINTVNTLILHNHEGKYYYSDHLPVMCDLKINLN